MVPYIIGQYSCRAGGVRVSQHQDPGFDLKIELQSVWNSYVGFPHLFKNQNWCAHTAVNNEYGCNKKAVFSKSIVFINISLKVLQFFGTA